MVNTEELGDFLRKIRKERGLSQEEAAEMAEISEKTLRNLENGRTIDPELNTILKLCDVYKISPEEVKRFYVRTEYMEEAIKIISDRKREELAEKARKAAENKKRKLPV